jgi:hypothetical protein
MSFGLPLQTLLAEDVAALLGLDRRFQGHQVMADAADIFLEMPVIGEDTR